MLAFYYDKCSCSLKYRNDHQLGIGISDMNITTYCKNIYSLWERLPFELENF